MDKMETFDNDATPEQPSPIDTPEAEEISPPPESEKHPLSLWRRALRVLLGIFIVFGLGSLLIIFLLFVPTRRELENSKAMFTESAKQSATELEAANQEIERLSALEATNYSLIEELNLANLQITILQLKNDVVTAQLALANGEVDKAQVALTNTEETLKNLEKLLPENQRGVVAGLLTRLELVFDGLADNLYAAQSDLDVLLTSLLELESALIR